MIQPIQRYFSLSNIAVLIRRIIQNWSLARKWYLTIVAGLLVLNACVWRPCQSIMLTFLSLARSQAVLRLLWYPLSCRCLVYPRRLEPWLYLYLCAATVSDPWSGVPYQSNMDVVQYSLVLFSHTQLVDCIRLPPHTKLSVVFSSWFCIITEHCIYLDFPFPWRCICSCPVSQFRVRTVSVFSMAWLYFNTMHLQSIDIWHLECKWAWHRSRCFHPRSVCRSCFGSSSRRVPRRG